MDGLGVLGLPKGPDAVLAAPGAGGRLAAPLDTGLSLENIRFRSPYYIEDQLFGAAELRLGGKKGDMVRIERTDGIAQGN